MLHIGSCAPSTPHQMPPGGLGRSPSLSPCLHKRLETPTGTQRPPLRPFPAAYTKSERNQRRVRPGSFPCSRSTRVIPPRRRAPERYRSQLLGNSGGRACMSAPPWQGGRGRSPSRKSRFLEARDAAGVLQAGGTASGKPGCTARAQDPKYHPEGPRCPQSGAAPMPGSAASCCLGSDPPVSVGVPRWGPQPQKWGEDLPLSLVGCAAPCSELRFHPAPSSRSQSGS